MLAYTTKYCNIEKERLAEEERKNANSGGAVNGEGPEETYDFGIHRTLLLRSISK